MNTNTTTEITGYCCKSCGAMSPEGVGYAVTAAYVYAP